MMDKLNIVHVGCYVEKDGFQVINKEKHEVRYNIFIIRYLEYGILFSLVLKIKYEVLNY